MRWSILAPAVEGALHNKYFASPCTFWSIHCPPCACRPWWPVTGTGARDSAALAGTSERGQGRREFGRSSGAGFSPDFRKYAQSAPRPTPQVRRHPCPHSRPADDEIQSNRIPYAPETGRQIRAPECAGRATPVDRPLPSLTNRGTNGARSLGLGGMVASLTADDGQVLPHHRQAHRIVLAVQHHVPQIGIARNQRGSRPRSRCITRRNRAEHRALCI